MTDQEVARALEKMIREDAQRPPAEQIRDLLEAGVIDSQGRVLIGCWNQNKPAQSNGEQKDSNQASSPSDAAGA